MRVRILLFAAVMSASPLGIARAQEQPATIPTELALALMERNLDAYGSRMPAIIVGHAPDGMPSSLTTLQGATILGGLADLHGSVVVLKSSLPPNQVLTAFDRQLLGSGWDPPPPPDVERGGFVSNMYTSSGSLYCSDSS